MFEKLHRAQRFDHITPNQYKAAYGAQLRREHLDLNLSGRDYYAEGLNALELQGHESILVVGSGDGYEEARLRIEYGHQGEIVALEIPSDNFEFEARFFVADEKIREAGKKDFKKAQGTAEEMPFDDNSFDVIIIDHMLYHSPDAYRALMEARRVGRRNAKVLMRSNGKNNKPKFHGMLGEMGKELGSTAPAPFSSRLTMQKLMKVGKVAFNPHRPVVQKDYSVIKSTADKALLLASFDTYRASFEPYVDAIRWDTARRIVVEPKIDEAIELSGAFTDIIERGGGVWVNNKTMSILGDLLLRKLLRPVEMTKSN